MKKAKKSIDASGLDRSSILKLIRSAYILGYTEIEIQHKNIETSFLRKGSKISVRDIIRDEVTHLIGATMTSPDDHRITIRIKDIEHPVIYDIIKRSIKKTVDMADELILLFKGHLYVATVIEEQHVAISRLVNYSIREINLTKDNGLHPLYYHILSTIDKLVDLIKYIARDYILSPRSLSPTALHLFQEFHEVLVALDQLYSKYAQTNVTAIFVKRDDMKRHIRESLKTIDPREAYLLGHAASSIELAVDLIQSKFLLENR